MFFLYVRKYTFFSNTLFIIQMYAYITMQILPFEMILFFVRYSRHTSYSLHIYILISVSVCMMVIFAQSQYALRSSWLNLTENTSSLVY